MGSMFGGGPRAPTPVTPTLTAPANIAPTLTAPNTSAPTAVADVQGQANAQNTNNAQQQVAFNRVDQTDAMGNSLNWSQNGVDAQGNPIFSANQTMGQTGQQYAGGLANLGQQYFNTAGQGAPNSQGAFDQAYGYASANLEPRFQRATAQMENKLRNQGLDPTSEAYKSASNDLALQQNEARNSLVTGLQGQMFNQGLQGRQQQMSELQPGLSLADRAMGGNYVNTPGVNVGNVDVAGLNNQNFQQGLQNAGLQNQYETGLFGQQNQNVQNQTNYQQGLFGQQSQNFNQQYQNYNTQMQQQNAMLGGLASIGGSLMMAPMTGGTSLGGMMGQSAMGGLGSLFGGGR